MEDTVCQRSKSPESWLLIDWGVGDQVAFERTVEPPPPIADAEASIFTNVTRRQDETASAMTLGRRCVVFARKKFLNVPLYMKYKFAGSQHTLAYEFAKPAQIITPRTRVV
jgi:hypothetical protein